MIIEISVGAILGYLAKEGIEFGKTMFKNRQLRKQAYFEKKIEVTIASIKDLSTIVIGLHNCALSIKWLKKSHEAGNWEAVRKAASHFVKEYSVLQEIARAFPHEITLFYHLPTFNMVFGQFNEMLEGELLLEPMPEIPEGTTTPEIIEGLKIMMSQLNKHFGNIISYCEKIEEKERLMDGCLYEIRKQFRENE